MILPSSSRQDEPGRDQTSPERVPSPDEEAAYWNTHEWPPVEGREQAVAKPLLLDAFCCQGGASKGYADAGFDVVGIDLDPQPRYPYPMHQGDALEALDELLWGGTVRFGDRLLRLDDFSAVAGSPPCQAYTLCQRIQGNEHPDLIDAIRHAFDGTGLPWIIENVEGAPLRDPVTLCGAMFPPLRVYRHRLFESNLPLTAPEHPEHTVKLRKMGRAPGPDDFMHVIPPAYTAHLGRQLMAAVVAPAQERADVA